MGAKKVRAGSPRRRKARKGNNTIFFLLFVVMPAMLFFMATCLLLVIGMLPTFSAWVSDRDPEKTAPITVGAVNLCGILPYLLQLWRGTNTFHESLTILAQPMTWLVMYGAAAVGWTLYFVIPPLVAGMVSLSHETKVRNLESKQQALIEEWGAEVTGEEVEEEELP